MVKHVKDISMGIKKWLYYNNITFTVSVYMWKNIGFYPGTGEQQFILSSCAEFLNEIKRQRTAVTEL